MHLDSVNISFFWNNSQNGNACHPVSIGNREAAKKNQVFLCSGELASSADYNRL